MWRGRECAPYLPIGAMTRAQLLSSSQPHTIGASHRDCAGAGDVTRTDVTFFGIRSKASTNPSDCGYSEEITTTLFRTSTLSAWPTLKPARSNHTPPNRIHGTHRIPL
ncbi:hypothetical protein CBM2637_A200502 [Cupriavidus taiwanensis]|nr:hypothetical protein CBM2637_A200502 [Cupriavidus taiwanensis]